MNTEALETRIAMLMGLLRDQEARGVERCTLQALAKKISEAQNTLIRMQQNPDQTPEVIRYEDGDDPNKPFRYGKPKRWPLRSTIRKGTQQAVKRAHPIPMPWHGRIA